MRLPLFTWFLLLLSIRDLGAGPTYAPLSQADSSLKAAYASLARGATDSARTLFNAVLLTSKPHTVRARLGLIQVDMAEKEWQDASHRCDTLLSDDPQNLAAHYYGGISQREWGEEVSGFYGWSRAEEHFEAILAVDSLYRDVLHQLALVKEDRRDFEEAIALAHRQLVLRPDLAEPALGLFHIYRHYLSATNPKEAFIWLAHQGDEYSRYFSGEVERRTHQWMEAEQVFLGLLKQPSRVPTQAPYLSLAHLYAVVNNPVRAQYCYWKAVDGIDNWLGAALVFDELKYIITDGELEQYNSLSSDRLKIAFFHQLWQVRDPMPATAINYRLIEHLQRYAQAEERFEYYGIRTKLSNPDRMESLRLPEAYHLNKEFNDLGVVFLRHGPPNRIERTMGTPPAAYTANAKAQMPHEMLEGEVKDPTDSPIQKLNKYLGNENVFGPMVIDPHQAWIYFASGDEPKRIFNFALHNTGSQNWRLTPLPGEEETLDKEMLDLLAMYDPRYERLKKTADKTQFNMNLGTLQIEEQKVIASALTTDRHVWNSNITQITVPHAIDAFRGTSSGTLLDISYAIPYAPLREAAGPKTKKVQVEVGLSTTSRSGSRVIDSKRDTLDLLLTPDGKGSYIGLFRQVLVADSVGLMAHVRALNVSALGTWNEQIRVPSFTGRDFMLSDLQLLLPATYGPLIEIDGVKVQQSPFKSYSSAEPLYAYIQIYNLIKDIKGAAAYTAKFTLAPKGDSEDGRVLAEVKRDLAEENTRSEFQMLDVKGVNPGKYILTVTVTDRKRVQTVTRSREIEITK